MSTTEIITCINCPVGCRMEVTHEGGTVLSVTGNTCKRGDIYARQELTNPVRIVTTSVPVEGSATSKMVSVKTAEPVPKGKIFDVMAALAKTEIKAPVHIGDTVLADVAGTGVDIVATRNA